MEVYLDKQQHDIFRDPLGASEEMARMISKLATCDDPESRVSLEGQIAVYMRRLGLLDDAEKTLRRVLGVIEVQNLGMARKCQNQIRLAHVLQWKKEFNTAIDLLGEVIETCEKYTELEKYLDFAWQHLGRCLFDFQHFEEALVSFDKALVLRIKKGDDELIDSTKVARQATLEKLRRV